MEKFTNISQSGTGRASHVSVMEQAAVELGMNRRIFVTFQVSSHVSILSLYVFPFYLCNEVFFFLNWHIQIVHIYQQLYIFSHKGSWHWKC